jgi:hypothetical protein
MHALTTVVVVVPAAVVVFKYIHAHDTKHVKLHTRIHAYM